VELPLVTVDELAEGRLVPSLRAGDEIAVHASFLPARLCSGPDDPVTQVDASGRGNRAPGVPAFPAVRRLPDREAEAKPV
jgi:hypothetical protein